MKYCALLPVYALKLLPADIGGACARLRDAGRLPGVAAMRVLR